MRIILARTAGFCMGVRRAMQIVVEQARNDPKNVWTHGPLIHNPQVIKLLEDKGVHCLKKDRPRDGDGTVVIRAHGVPPQEKEDLCACGYEVVDATCPHVIRIQKLIERHVKEGMHIIIVGDHGHAEVNGLLGFAGDKGHVVAGPKEVQALPDMDKVCVVSQTTQSESQFDAVLAEINARWPDAKVHRTICNATDKRQAETVALARKVEAMIVVGGKNSANTQRLAELSREAGAHTLHVETSQEIDFSRVRRCKTVGITAGASTPNWMIVEVMERLKESALDNLPGPARWGVRLVQWLVQTHLYLALGALGMGLAGLALHPLNKVDWPLQAIFAAVFYVFAMYSFTIPTEENQERYCDPLRWRFHLKWRKWILAAGILSLCAALGLSALLGNGWCLALMGLASVLGIVYRLVVLPAPLRPLLPYQRLMDIPGSKDLVMALAWATLLTLLPLLSGPSPSEKWENASWPLFQATAICFFFVFTLVFTRSVLFDLRDIQADQIVGRETIPVVLGKNRTKVLLAILTGFLFLAMTGGALTGVLTPAAWLMLLPIGYTWAYLYLYHRRAIMHGLSFEVVLGGNFILSGILALAWWLI